jgi:hypothetical protein
MLQNLELSAQVCHTILSASCLSWLIWVDTSNLTDSVCVACLNAPENAAYSMAVTKQSKRLNTTSKSSCNFHIGILHHFLYSLIDTFHCAIFKRIHKKN